MIFPYKVDIDIFRRPFTNLLLVLVTSGIFLLSFFPQYFEYYGKLLLDEGNAVQVFGSIFLHPHYIIFIINIIMIFVFGNAVCSVIGNLLYPVLFFILAGVASLTHLYFDANPVVGAHGVISGLAAVLLIWFPKSRVKFYYFFWFFSKLIHGSFHIRIVWVVIIYFFGHILVTQYLQIQASYYVYAGGFGSGILLAFLSQMFHIWHLGDDTLVDIIKGNKKGKIVNDISELPFINEEELPTEAEPEMNMYSEAEEMFIPDVNPEQVQPVSEVVKVAEAVPKFRILKVQRNSNEYKYFITNQGDSVSNLEIISSDGINYSIEPSDKFKNKDAGVIKFTDTGQMNMQKHLILKYKAGERNYEKKLTLDLKANEIELFE